VNGLINARRYRFPAPLAVWFAISVVPTEALTERFTMIHATLPFEHRDAAASHRITTPVPHRVSHEHAFATDDVIAASAALAGDTKIDVVPEAEREDYARTTTLWQFYHDWMDADRRRSVSRGLIAGSTLQKDRQSLRCWAKFTMPDTWPSDRAWPGPTLAFINNRVIENWMDSARDALAFSTVKGRWSHLRAILNEAVRRKAIDFAPRMRIHETNEDDFTINEFWKPNQIEQLHNGLATFPILQTAFTLGCNGAMRAVDLFLLEWKNFEPPAKPGDVAFISFRSRKTKKRQRIPLAPVTAAHVMRLPRVDQYLFPGMSSPDAKDPEKSMAARRRTFLFKQVAIALGIDVDKPWQRCRVSCNERMERHQFGSGQFLLGHAMTLNSRSYRDPSDTVIDAVMTVDQPECFGRILAASA